MKNPYISKERHAEGAVATAPLALAWEKGYNNEPANPDWAPLGLPLIAYRLGQRDRDGGFTEIKQPRRIRGTIK